MQAIEFQTRIRDGIIKVPKEYHNLNESDVRIILLKNDYKSGEKNSFRIKENIERLRTEYEDVKAFKDISDPVEWQKGLRNEWS